MDIVILMHEEKEVKYEQLLDLQPSADEWTAFTDNSILPSLL